MLSKSSIKQMKDRQQDMEGRSLPSWMQGKPPWYQTDSETSDIERNDRKRGNESEDPEGAYNIRSAAIKKGNIINPDERYYFTPADVSNKENTIYDISNFGPSAYAASKKMMAGDKESFKSQPKSQPQSQPKYKPKYQPQKQKPDNSEEARKARNSKLAEVIKESLLEDRSQQLVKARRASRDKYGNDHSKWTEYNAWKEKQSNK
jgi:hypothetical protein